MSMATLIGRDYSGALATPLRTNGGGNDDGK